MQKSMKERGFTLIELLIVIVIIGILAGVVISIINPARQQNRAKDANVQATINKIALSTQGYNSAYGAYPDGLNVLQSLENASAYTGSCLVNTDTCVFRFFSDAPGTSNPITNIDLPADQCGAIAGTAYLGGATGQCWYGYVRDVPNSRFYVYAKSFGTTNLFRYNSDTSKIETCNAAGTTCL